MVPTDVVTMSVFHVLARAGSLAIDNASLTRGSGTSGDNFAKGMVSLTFDDGWLSHYTNVFPTLSAAGLKGTFAIISGESLKTTVGNQVQNPGLESKSGATPTHWQSVKTGTNNAVFTYPVAGHDSTSGARIAITAYTDGDAKWYFDDVPVLGNAPYHFSVYSMSNVSSTIIARYTSTSGAVSYGTLATAPPSSMWTYTDAYFNVPPDAQSMTVFHVLSGVGTLSIDDAELTQIPIHVNPAQIIEMQNSGQEIGVHSRTHGSLIGLPPAQLLSETKGAKDDLLSIGVSPANTFVYPYGDYDDPAIAQLKSTGFIGARSVDRGYNTKSTDKFKLKIQQVDVNTTAAQVKAWVDNAVSTNTWLILMFHQVDSGGGNLSTSPATFQEMIDYLKAQNTSVVTMSQGVAQMNP
jgi:peptidoglycan/xylan/chitin deacetylase (PgdA/CDA1 family)